MNKIKKIVLLFSLIFLQKEAFTQHHEVKKNIASTILIGHIGNIFQDFLSTNNETLFFDSLNTIFIDSKLSHEKFIDLIMLILKYHPINQQIITLSQEDQDEFLSSIWFFIEEILVDDIHTQISIAHEELSTNLHNNHNDLS